jgi:hypothetical protein
MKPYLLTILVLSCAMPEESKINEGKLSTVFEKYVIYLSMKRLNQVQ